MTREEGTLGMTGRKEGTLGMTKEGGARDDKGGGWVTGVMHKGTVKGCANEARGKDFFYFSLSI
jgi:hypothetical protein